MEKLLLFILGIIFFGSHFSLANELKIESAPQSVGFYAKGKLINPDALPEQQIGYVNLFRYRKHYFGTQGLIEIIQRTAEIIQKKYPEGERLQVGDLSQKLGGKVEGHGSHQNGLDVDFIYFNNAHREQNPENRHMVEQFVQNGKITKNFDIERNWILFRVLVDSGRISRMFVDPKIKLQMCQFASQYDNTEEAVETLRRMRAWPNHANHVHVRITCPEGSSKCVPQPEVEFGSGCPKKINEFDKK